MIEKLLARFREDDVAIISNFLESDVAKQATTEVQKKRLAERKQLNDRCVAIRVRRVKEVPPLQAAEKTAHDKWTASVAASKAADDVLQQRYRARCALEASLNGEERSLRNQLRASAPPEIAAAQAHLRARRAEVLNTGVRTETELEGYNWLGNPIQRLIGTNKPSLDRWTEAAREAELALDELSESYVENVSDAIAAILAPFGQAPVIELIDETVAVQPAETTAA
jgi:hypothetical protein